MIPLQRARIAYYHYKKYKISLNDREGFWRFSLWQKKPKWFTFYSEYIYTSPELALQEARLKVKDLRRK